MSKFRYIILAAIFAIMPAVALADAVADTTFEGGSLSGWDAGLQTGTFVGNIITGTGTGVSVASGTVTFNAPGNAWTFSPYGSKAGMLQPNGSQTFDEAISNLGLSSSDNTSLRNLLLTQSQQTGNCCGNPTDAAWITKTVSLTAGTTYTMSWNYIGTDYVPFNDGSITSLVPVTGSATVTVNNQVSNYALLGFTNPGTGDYSTGSYGSTGWQMSTYQVSVTGNYKIGFAAFNLDDQVLSPVLLIDSQPGGTTKNGENFGAVPPNNSDAPTVPPTVTDPPATDPPATDPVVTDPPATDPPATDPPATDPPATDPPATDLPATDPPATDPIITTTTDIDTRPGPVTTVEEPEMVSGTTTTQTPDSTTTTTQPIQVVDELPKTGKGITIIYIGFISCIIGYIILAINKRMINDGF